MGIDWDSLRETEFPVARRWAYFDHAAVAPLPRRSGDVLRAWAAEQEQNGVVDWPRPGTEARGDPRPGRAADQRRPRRDRLRRTARRTASAWSPRGFPGGPGDNVVTAAEEYPSNIYPWMNLASRGVALRLVPSREGRIWIDDLAAAIDGSTRVLDDQPRRVRHRVSATTSMRLAELCRGRGVALFVDAIQGLGPAHDRRASGRRSTSWPPTAISGCSGPRGRACSTSAATGSTGCGRSASAGTAWSARTTRRAIEFRLKPSAERWEGGSFNMPGLQAFGASLRLAPGDRARRRLAADPRARRGRPRAGPIGWLELPARPAAGDRSGDRGARAARGRSRARAVAGAAAARVVARAGGAGSGSARIFTMMRTTSTGSRAGSGRLR